MRVIFSILVGCSPVALDSGLDLNSGGIQALVYSGELEGHLFMPPGDGLFGVVVYNHGGLGDVLGGDPLPTSR